MKWWPGCRSGSGRPRPASGTPDLSVLGPLSARLPGGPMVRVHLMQLGTQGVSWRCAVPPCEGRGP
jgi:hypothetical protein